MSTLIVAGVTEMVVGRGLPDPLLPPRPDRERVALLTQPGATHIALQVAARLRDEGVQVEVIGLPDREEAKSLVVAGSVYEALARFGLARHDTVVGVGGGSVSDLAGFVAGTWLRGVEVVHVPTTLLAAVEQLEPQSLPVCREAGGRSDSLVGQAHATKAEHRGHNGHNQKQ